MISLSHEEDDTDLAGLDFSRRSVNRVFSYGSFELGGRLYGPWWQPASKNLRRQILIDGSPTVELDYKSQFAHFAYSSCGLDYMREHPDEAEPDPYALPDIPRKLSKSAFIIVLNTADRMQAIKAMNREWRDEKFDDVRGLDIAPETIIEATLRKHAAIATMFFRPWGLQFQCIDSRICERNIIACLENDTPVLTVHDSFIVKNEHADWMKGVMYESAEDVFPPSIPTITFG